MTDDQFERIKKGLNFHSEGGIYNLCTLTETTLRTIIEDATKELEAQINRAFDVLAFKRKRIAELEAQIEKMKKYGKLLQDICVVLGNDNFMVAVQLESVVKKLWDASEEKEGLKMVEDIENRLLKIKPQEWAEINEWEIKEND